MEKKLSDGTVALSVLAVGFFFSYMYKWNKIIESNDSTRSGLERRVFLLTHAAVSALIGVVCFYGLDQFYPHLNLMLKMSLAGLGAVMSDFIIPVVGALINKVGVKWKS